MGNAKLKDETNDGQVFADELAPGAELMHGQYKIESFLNAGGFGITYSARDSLDRRVVIKECFPGAFCRRSRVLVQARSRAHQNELASIVRLFVQEARSLAKLNHPNIVGVHQVFEENNTAYMALDYVEGRDLLDIIEDPEASLSPVEVERVLRKVLDAVGFIHDQGILHRDISPDNILIDSHGEPVLIDFGAAREQATKQSRVLSALRVVKDGYSPQEFYITGSEQGPYSDLYALGASFYHLVANDVPPNSQARLSSVATGEGDPYQALAGQYPDYKDSVLESIDKALEILPKDRIASAAHWQAMIDGKKTIAAEPVKAFEAEETVAQAAPAKSKAAEKEPKSKKGLLLATVAVAALACGGFLATQTDLLSGGTTPAVETVPAVATPLDESSEAAAVSEPEAQPVDTAVVEEAPVAEPEADPIVVEEDLAVANVPVEATADAAPELVTDGQIAPDVVATPLPQPSSQELVIGTTDIPVNTVEDWARSIPDIAPSAPLALPGAGEETSDQSARRAVIDSLPKPSLEQAEPAITDPVAESAAAEIAASEDAPVDLFREIVGQPEAPQNDVLATFDTSIPPAPASPEVDGVAVPGVSQDFEVLLPLRGLFDLGEGATRIFAVNGNDVDTLAAFNAVVRGTEDLAKTSTVDLSVTMGTTRATAKTQDWTLPVAQTITLGNGWMFETVSEGEVWVTRVTSVPVGASTDIREGDIVYGFIPTAQRLDQQNSLHDILAREVDAGTTLYNFAIKRGELAFATTLQFDARRFVN